MLVLLNPASNRGRVEQFRALVRQRAEQEQATYVETTRPGEAQEQACRAAQEGNSIIMVGGDGTLHEVANGILSAGKKVPLGIVPAGSGNDYAWSALKLPRDPAAAVERAFNGTPIDVDAGITNKRYFVNACSVGLDADIAAVATRMKRWPFMSGNRLYYGATLHQLLFGYRNCPWLSFTLDNDTSGTNTQKRYVLLAVTNGQSYGAGFRISPNSDHTDGLFDVCTIDYVPLPISLQRLPLVRRGAHVGSPEVTFYRAKSLSIEARKPLYMQMDGEIIRDSRFLIEILPAALCVRI